MAKKSLIELGYDVQPCGLCLHPEVLGIAASPDGLIGTDGVLEIKCPFTAKHMDPEVAIRDRKNCTSEKPLTLRTMKHF